MAARLEVLARPAPTVDHTQPSRYRPVGFFLGLVGLVVATIAVIGNFVAAGDVGDGTSTRETLAWTFALTTASFGTIKLGIVVILMGVLLRAWMRVESVKAALPQLKAAGGAAPSDQGEIDSPQGRAVATATAPGTLMIHKIAPKLWAPMLAMGVMGLTVGVVLGFIQAATDDAEDFATIAAWNQGLMFLAEGFMLAAISFLLASILRVLRDGGGEAQEALGVTVKTLRMPLSAKAFMAIMMMGMMIAMVQFVLYIIVAYADDRAAWFAWLGTFRELSLGLLLMGIVLALYTIGTVLSFQFNRMRDIVTTGD
jgi:hypothetical protein